MKSLSVLVLLVAFNITAIAFADFARSGRNVDIKSSDGTILKGTYLAAAKSGPGALLFHQSNRTRESWDGVGQQLAAAGMNVLTVDSRGHGESGGKYDNKKTPEDVDAAFNYLVSQPGVNRDAIGAGGAGWLGVIASVEAARRHPKEIKSLVLMSGETLRDGLQFLHQAARAVRVFRPRRISADARRDETALCHSIQPQQETGALLGRGECAVALVRDIRCRKGFRSRWPWN